MYKFVSIDQLVIGSVTALACTTECRLGGITEVRLKTFGNPEQDMNTDLHSRRNMALSTFTFIICCLRSEYDQLRVIVIFSTIGPVSQIHWYSIFWLFDPRHQG